ncbi:MAG: hypothetical protein GWN84_08740, partial [Gammaproteobacteria bacterium]|nr:hypothetical protein [Gammaproteobacteria bacterium]NIR82983.1 hypothetical protein [Gammaproteobacteria bacterium]NIR90614.1 hypothetical protein [Gammaproteobacteria bacterium]NIU04125.1 hypothetical protein [Gammaproteobacteria bacterium]NIX85399.1 hypothetical protein [Gammaproteobacteria bacterium]
MPERYVGRMFQIDTNRINARQKDESMNQLEQWKRDGVICLDMADTAFNEATAGKSAARTRKAQDNLISLTAQHTEDEQRILEQIEQILCPGGAKSKNDQNDVRIVFNAWRWRRILITEDGNILWNKKTLREAIGVEVMTAPEAEEKVAQRIRRRDAGCRRVAAQTGSG